MPKTSTSLTAESRKGMPPRGRGKQALILESIREAALLELNKDSTKEESEKAVFKFMADAAFNPTADTAQMSSFCLGQLMKKGWPDVKAEAAPVNFYLDSEAGPAEQTKQIMKAIAKGELAPDTGVSLITAMASVIKIIEITELEERLKALEDNNNG